MGSKKGHLVIIGGAEDREDGKAVLGKVCELAGGAKGRIVVLTSASRRAGEDEGEDDDIQKAYERAFKDCGASEVTSLAIFDRASANDPKNAEIVGKATGIFMTGGEQGRLVSILGGTAVRDAMKHAYLSGGACISGTSAGASAMSEHMLAGGPSEPAPRKGTLALAAGLGFVRHVLIDQHFSARQRLGRLLTAIAQNPFLVGVGIDEDTALVICPNHELEVVGSGAVTILDGRTMDNRAYVDARPGDLVGLTNVRLHFLPPGYESERHAVRKDDPIGLGPITFMDALDAVIMRS
jgi:cyanophycinase